MFASFVITFREVLEAALVVIVVLAYFKKTGQTGYFKDVAYGIAAGIGLSVLVAVIFNFTASGFHGDAEKIFEGVMMLGAAVLITWMIVWMMFQKNIALKLEERVGRALTSKHAYGVIALVAVAIMREGVETVIFLQAASYSGGASFVGAVSGSVFAVVVGYLLFMGSGRMRIKLFFQVSSVILILFAAGLISHALLEFQQAGLVSPVIDHLYDISWLVHKKSAIGTVLNTLFGYTGRPSLVEMAGYLGYFALTYLLYRNVERITKERSEDNQVRLAA